jgi:hypothetical protein
VIKCPSCLQGIHRGAAHCPHCGFELAQADARYGAALRWPCFHDAAGLVRSAQRYRLGRLWSRFERRFPQLSLAVATLPAGPEDLREHAFWLLNRVEFDDWPEDRPRTGLVLLVMDAQAKAATLAWGYLLDGHLSESDTFQILRRAHAYWLEERYGDGILRVIEQLELTLMRRSRQAQRQGRRVEAA